MNYRLNLVQGLNWCHTRGFQRSPRGCGGEEMAGGGHVIGVEKTCASQGDLHNRALGEGESGLGG